jgi:hypothetical protein
MKTRYPELVLDSWFRVFQGRIRLKVEGSNNKKKGTNYEHKLSK